jgi:hypothetical protein
MINHTTTDSSGSSVTSDETVRTVTFSARSVDELNRQVNAWLMEHPSTVPLSFSHAAGILLVRPSSAPVKAAQS